MNKKELDKILEEHKLWLINYTKGKKADLRMANLSRTNLIGANLNGAELNNEEEFRKGEILKESMIGYKKCRNCLVTLEIPKGGYCFWH